MSLVQLHFFQRYYLEYDYSALKIDMQSIKLSYVGNLIVVKICYKWGRVFFVSVLAHMHCLGKHKHVHTLH